MADSQHPDPYEYDHLPTGDMIRYLTLLPGSGTEPIQCTLHTARMAEAQFEAMSYVWGSDVRDQEILCNDHVFKITTNLSRVLHRVRRSDQSRDLWADLVCINQEDLDEKGHQVSIMGQIYRRANRVLILMGDDEGHVDQVVSLVDEVCNVIDKMIPSIDQGWNTFPFPRGDEHILVDERWDSLGVLLKDSWFGRGWVVREAGFATDGLVLWGNSEFSWDKLMRTINWLYKRAVKTLYTKGLDGRIPLAHLEVFEDRFPTYAKLFTTEMTWVDQSLLGYLSLTRQLKLKDPRDRIYAFLELVNTERRIHVRPNYKDHFLHVYQEFAVAYIKSTAYIGLLGNVEHDQASLVAMIPSWVPRWDLSLTKSGYSFSPPDSGYAGLQARDGSTMTPTIFDFNTLKTYGVIFDTISYASNTLDSTTTTPDTISAIWRVIESLRDHDLPYPQEYRLTVLLTILTAGTREGDIKDWLLSEATYYQEIHAECKYPDELEPPNRWAGHVSSHMFHNMVKGYTQHRKIIVTKRGYLGLAPAMAERGDCCGVLFGCTTPSILRKTERSDRFQYLGATYILGKHHWFTQDGRAIFHAILGSEDSKDWTDWDAEEEYVYLV